MGTWWTLSVDPSRYALGLYACGDEREGTRKSALTAVFRRYGVPGRPMDNAPPWGTAAEPGHARFSAWLMELGIALCHGRPYHPQTQGQNERFHRTLFCAHSSTASICRAARVVVRGPSQQGGG